MDIVISDLLTQDNYFRWLTLYRPVSEIRIGGFSLRERLEYLFGKDSIYLLVGNDHQANVLRRKLSLPVQLIPDNTFILLNSKLIASFQELERLVNYLDKMKEGSCIYKNGVFLAGKISPDDLEGFKIKRKLSTFDYPTTNLFFLTYPWDIFKVQSMLISDDVFSSFIKKEFSILKPNRGKWPVYISKNDVFIEKYVYFDTSKGPIIISDNAEINAFSRISGPSIIRENSNILSGLIRENSVIGPTSKIGGEVADSLIDGYSNKAHESYFGHSYAGEWVNIGAHTVTSDLKNTYGTIKIEMEGGRFDTGLIKLGAFIGDFAKLSIHSSIFAGKFIGPFSHTIGLVYRDIPPFTLWNGFTRKGYELELSSVINTQKRMYSRRGFPHYDEEVKFVEYLYKETSQYRDWVSKGRFSL